ncbi:hypothetical protein HMPREF1493_0502 [Atopobium sp. ICM42b]|nr:hypothetical protein HMPREF1493_0502 [Atopobium sp. ICM42b]
MRLVGVFIFLGIFVCGRCGETGFSLYARCAPDFCKESVTFA